MYNIAMACIGPRLIYCIDYDFSYSLVGCVAIDGKSGPTIVACTGVAQVQQIVHRLH